MDFIEKTIGEVDLESIYVPVGWDTSEGVMGRFCTMDELDGEVEESIADPKIKDNFGKIITNLLYGIVTSMEGYKRVTKDGIRNLSSTDRDFLLVLSHKISFGDTLNWEDNCKYCNAINEITYDINTLKVRYLPQEHDRIFTFNLPRPVKDNAGNEHTEMSIHLPDGWVQEKVATFGRSNPAQATTTMLQMMCRRLGTLEAPISMDIFKKMKSKNRLFVNRYLEELNLGVQLTVEETCIECGKTFTSFIPMTSLLGE